MDAALVFTWKSPFVGREKLAIEFSVEVIEYFEKKATEGRSTELEWFLSPSGPFQFTMVKGDYEFLTQLMNTDEFLTMQSKGTLLLDDYHYYLYGTGDRAAKVIGSFGAVGAEFGLV